MKIEELRQMIKEIAKEEIQRATTCPSCKKKLWLMPGPDCKNC